MEIVVAILGLAMVVVVAAFIAQPFVARSRVLASNESPRDQLLAERDMLYATIRDLDFDFQTGKLLEADYRAMREKYVARGVEILKQLDAMPVKSQVGAKPVVADKVEAAVQARRKTLSPEDEIEAAIRARRQSALRNLNCPNCGRPVDPTDRFCGKCGAVLTVEATH
jgi:hypothetical protein